MITKPVKYVSKSIISTLIIFLTGSVVPGLYGQTDENEVVSASNFQVARAAADRNVTYSVSDTGVALPVIWGLDTAWPDEANIRRGVAFMGADRVDIVRASFQPTLPLVDGELQDDQVYWINYRLDLVDLTGPDTKVALNCDHPTVDDWYAGDAGRWAQLMDVTTRRVQERGRTVVSIAPFNEPDYGWGQGTIVDFYNIAGELRQNPRFDDIRISGGNTLNTDEALNWYSVLKTRLDEGNTHQLAGSFDNYAAFHETVRANGHHATNDELHNVMEAMVGVEYGLQTGIWWGTAELARGEFVKASDGRRLAYAEHRPNWTAASVYRAPDGKVQAFGGTSERQAVTTSYLFVSKDRDVYYDGHGPQRDYTMVLPGGTGYQVGQTNAERVVNITWGDDIQPVINGRYVLVNRKSGLVMEVAGGSTAAGANLQQAGNTGVTYQQWNVIPVSSRIMGDFSYFTITAAHSLKAIDVFNWSLENGGNLAVWDDTKGVNQQWFLEYAEDGWFYIRSRYSALCLEVVNGSTTEGANIQQWEKDGGENQQWRFLPIDATVEFDPPAAPAGLVATGNAESVRLDWSASPETDLSGYTVYRSETAGGPYETLARNITTTAFVDNTTTMGGKFYYVIRAVDSAMNRSEYSTEVSATPTGEHDLIAQFHFEGNTMDSSVHLNHGASYGDISYVEGRVGTEAIYLDGEEDFLQLPATLANQEEISVATWVYWNGGAPWQRIFDFGNNESQYMYLTPRMRLAIMNGGPEQRLDAPALQEAAWFHVAVTLDASGAAIYLDGERVGETTDFTIRPVDFMPIHNYIGRSQSATPLFDGYIDDFQVFNYGLSAEEVARLYQGIPYGLDEKECDCLSILSLWPVPASDVLYVGFRSELHEKSSLLNVIDINGRVVASKEIRNSGTVEVDVSVIPSGIYLLRVTGGDRSAYRKFVIRH